MADEHDSPYVADTGPGFDPAEQVAAPADEQAAAQAAETGPKLDNWDGEQVEAWLKRFGEGAHLMLGAGERDWLMTAGDLERIGPPLTRILNRYEPIRAAAEYSDEGQVLIGVGTYTVRSALQRRAAIKRREALERGEPATQAAPAEPEPAPASPGPSAAMLDEAAERVERELRPPAVEVEVAPDYTTAGEQIAAAMAAAEQEERDAQH